MILNPRTFARGLVFSVILAALASTVFYQSVTPGISLADIEKYLNDLETKGFSGCVLLAKDGKVLLKKGYGLADREGNRRVTPETGFDIGSITKVFTAAAIFKLEADGKLRVDDKITKYFKNVPPDKSEITIEQLITHRSGLPDLVTANGTPTMYTTDYDFEPVSRDEIVKSAMLSKLLYSPGSSMKYSNTGYSLLGAIIEMTSGKSYERFVYEKLFLPAGMKKTGYQIPNWKSKDLAVGYDKDHPWGTPLDHAWLKDGPSWNLRANGGMISTVDDLNLWVTALQTDKLLPKESKDKFFASMGLRANQRGVRVMGPAGGNGIFNAVYMWIIEENRVLVVLSNVDKFPAEDHIGKLAGMMLKSGH